MLNFFIGLLTVLMLLSCGLLTLLVLVQLPKKEAGAGMAFGAGTADALLGAGSGNALTKITKYTAAAFFVLCVALWLTYNHKNRSSIREVNRALEQVDAAPAALVPAAQPAATTAPAQSSSLFATNLPAMQSTNSAAKP
jgi:protein translocase SecG subunit